MGWWETCFSGSCFITEILLRFFLTWNYTKKKKISHCNFCAGEGGIFFKDGLTNSALILSTSDVVLVYHMFYVKLETKLFRFSMLKSFPSLPAVCWEKTKLLQIISKCNRKFHFSLEFRTPSDDNSCHFG